MFFRQIYEKGLAHASYMVGCQKSGTVAVIDAKRDVDTYLEIAAQENLRITQVLETHIHADFLCGSRELHEICGAEIMVSDEGGSEWMYNFPHRGLRDGMSFMVGNIRFEVWHTPGHTPEHISFLVTDTPASDKAIMFFSGDFVFVGDVGRPDLLERAAGYSGTMVAGAHDMFRSLQRFKTLPDYVQVHPAHGAGSACGKSLGDIPHSTVGYEKLVNWALQYSDEEAFVKALLDGQPEPPSYFAQMKRLNKEPRALLCTVPSIPQLNSAELEAHLNGQTQVVDTRSKEAFCNGFIPSSLFLHNNNSLSTWAGWMLSYDRDILLLCAASQLEEIQRRLMRIGLDRICGWYEKVEAWQSERFPLQHISMMSTAALDSALKANDTDLQILDVRKLSEYNAGHSPGARHIHAGYLKQQLDELPRDKTLAIMCASGNRSTIACSLLSREGIHNFVNIEGGFEAWEKGGFEVER